MVILQTWEYNFLLGLIFSTIGEFYNFFQNQNGVMIILKIAYNFTVLEGIFETLFHI